MKKFIYPLIGLILFASVFAIGQPPSYDFEAAALSQPVQPSTGTTGDCTPWEVKDKYCIGDVAHFTQCHKTVAGGVWQVKSIDCKMDWDNVCFEGECMKPSEKDAKSSGNMIKWVLIGAGILLVVWALGRGKK